MGRPPSHPSTRHPRPVPGGGRCAHSGIPERPARSPAPSFPARSLLLGAAFRLVAPGSGGRGTAREPGSPGGWGPSRRPAGMRPGGARLCGRARRAGLEPGVCCLRSGRRALVPAALPRGGGHKAIHRPRPHAGHRGPRAGRNPAKLPSPRSPFPRPQAPAPLGPRWLRPCNGRAGYALGALPAQASVLVPRSNVLGPQHAGSAASGPARSRSSCAPADTRLRGLATGSPGRPGRAAERGEPRVAPSPPWPARLAPPPRAGPRTRVRPLGTPRGWGPGGRRGAAVAVAVAVAEGGALPRAAGRGRPRPPAGLPAPSVSSAPARARPILGSPRPPRPPARASAAGRAGRWRLSQAPSPVCRPAWPSGP